MPATPPLPNLDRVITLCRRHRLPLELLPPLSTAPRAGELIFAQPLDPMLAALYQRVGGGDLGTFSLLRPDHDPDYGLFRRNQRFKRDGEEPFRSTHLFAKETGFSYYLGTVPALADSAGFQPIVFIAFYPVEVYGAPIASNLDRFFDLYARYLELIVVDDEYVATGIPGIGFPWEMARLVAQDRPLIELMRAGRFNHLLNGHHDAESWVSDVLGMLK